MSNHTQNPGDSNNAIHDLEMSLKRIQALEITDPIAFSSRALIQATFPHSARAADKNEIVLINGNLTVTMYSRKGLPYGRLARLIMLWLTRECVRRNGQLPMSEARHIPLGNSLHAFLRQIGALKGVYKDGTTPKRANGRDYQSLRKQLIRLFATSISFDWIETHECRKADAWENIAISEAGFLWWDENHSEDEQEPYVLLTEKFFKELVEHAVPLNPIHIAHIQRSPLALDIYSWATYRISYHSGFTRVTWAQLKGQIGTAYPDTEQGMRDFRKATLKAVSMILEVWPGRHIEANKSGIFLTGKEPAISKRKLESAQDWYGGHAPF